MQNVFTLVGEVGSIYDFTYRNIICNTDKKSFSDRSKVLFLHVIRFFLCKTVP